MVTIPGEVSRVAEAVLLNCNRWIEKNERVILVGGGCLLSSSVLLAYFTRRRTRDVTALQELNETPLVDLPSLVARSSTGKAIVKVKGIVKGELTTVAPYSKSVVALWQASSLLKRRTGGRAIRIEDEAGNSVYISEDLFWDRIASRYLKWHLTGLYFKPNPVFEWVIPLDESLMIVAEANLLSPGKVILCLPDEGTQTGRNPFSPMLDYILSLQSTRFRVSYFLTQLDEEELVGRLLMRRNWWNVMQKSTAAVGGVLLWWRHVVMGGKCSSPLTFLSMFGALGIGMRLWFEEELVRRQEHQFSLVSNSIIREETTQPPPSICSTPRMDHDLHQFDTQEMYTP